jgi:hypothetical protein
VDEAAERVAAPREDLGIGRLDARLGRRVGRVVDDAQLREARVALCAAVRQVLRNALSLLGVSAPEKM